MQTKRAKILNASAGSGKTYQLAFQYVRDVIEEPELYRHILAVTFTNKATEEMKSRILKEIHNLAAGNDSSYLTQLSEELALDEQTIRKRAAEVRAKILHDYSRFTVLTIDTFFQRILRAFIKELGIDLNYNVEIETSSVLSKGADALIEQITVDRDLQRWLSEFVQERIDDGLKWDVRDGILSLAGEIFKEKNKSALTGARSREELGRIVARATHLAEASKKELRETARQALGIIGAAGLSLDDFPYKATGFAKWFYTAAEGSLEPYKTRVAEAADSDDKWGKKGSPSRNLAPQLRPLLQRMRDIYDANLRHWNTCDLLRENYRSFALLADLYARVQQLCEEQNLMLLSETKYLLAEFIDHNDAPFIYEKVGNRFDRFMIDEFQDTSAKEWENFLPLLRNAMAQTDEQETSVLLVGDIKQSIYRWRGGDWRILHEQARQALGPAETQVEVLRENWRSLPQIVEFNNRIIARIVETDGHILLRPQFILRSPVLPAGPRTEDALGVDVRLIGLENLALRRMGVRGAFLGAGNRDLDGDVLLCLPVLALVVPALHVEGFLADLIGVYLDAFGLDDPPGHSKIPLGTHGFDVTIRGLLVDAVHLKICSAKGLVGFQSGCCEFRYPVQPFFGRFRAFVEHELRCAGLRQVREHIADVAHIAPRLDQLDDQLLLGQPLQLLPFACHSILTSLYPFTGHREGCSYR